jgi:hypothetical protein
VAISADSADVARVTMIRTLWVEHYLIGRCRQTIL